MYTKQNFIYFFTESVLFYCFIASYIKQLWVVQSETPWTFPLLILFIPEFLNSPI